MRRIPCKLLLAFAILLFTVPTFAAERGIKRVEIKTQAGELVGLYEESHALVIGVSNYTGGWPDLESVTKDVEALSTTLLAIAEACGAVNKNIPRKCYPKKNG